MGHSGNGQWPTRQQSLARNAVVSAAELESYSLAPPRAIVPGLLYTGHSLLVGPPKLGKSWLALQVALAVAEGGEIFGYRVPQGRVLYAALEDTWPRLKTRLSLLRPDGNWPADFHLTTDWPRMDEGGKDLLTSYLDHFPTTRLVLMDTLEKIRPIGGREYSYARDYHAGAALKAIADEREINATSIHHLRKMPSDDPLEQISGSSGLLGAVDGVLLFRRERARGAVASLLVTGRDVEEENELRLAGGPGRGWWLDETTPRIDSDERAAVRNLLQTVGMPITVKELHARFPSTMALATLRKRLDRMTQDGEVSTVAPDGEAGRAGLLYVLTPKSPAAGGWRFMPSGD